MARELPVDLSAEPHEGDRTPVAEGDEPRELGLHGVQIRGVPDGELWPVAFFNQIARGSVEGTIDRPLMYAPALDALADEAIVSNLDGVPQRDGVAHGCNLVLPPCLRHSAYTERVPLSHNKIGSRVV